MGYATTRHQQLHKAKVSNGQCNPTKLTTLRETGMQSDDHNKDSQGAQIKIGVVG